MRLNPISQETRRYRQSDRPVFDGVYLHAREPTREHILAEFNAQPVFDPLPALLIRARHFGLLFAGNGHKASNSGEGLSTMPDIGKRNAHESLGFAALRKAKCSHRSDEERLSRWG
jgi:hypothetical protein